MTKLRETFRITNHCGPNIKLAVSDDGYKVNGKLITPETAWLLDTAALTAKSSYAFGYVLDTWMRGHGDTFSSFGIDCATIVDWINEHWDI